MHSELARVLDECLARLRKGETIAACLADFTDLRCELEPLLSTAMSIATAPKIKPSDEFRSASRTRLLVRIRENSKQMKAAKPNREAVQPGILEIVYRRLVQSLTRPRGLVVPVTSLLLLAMAGSLLVIVGVGLPSPPSALASQCTVSVLSGSPQIQIPGSDTWEEAVDGMVLDVGSSVRTPEDSYAMLTFFEGSSIKLEPGTDIQIQRVEASSGYIVLNQWAGITWSRVVKMLDADTHYEIQTPSAHALVRGTLFETQVDESGATTVRTSEGLVSVRAQGQEVFVSPGQEVSVESGAAPSTPRPVAPANTKLHIIVSMPAVASVCDPTGSCTGCLPNGFAFNQITGAKSTEPSRGDQVITVPNPMSGRYLITLRGVTEGTSQMDLACMSGGEPVFLHTSSHEVTEASEWLISLDLDVVDGEIVNAVVTGIEPLHEQTPEETIEPEATSALTTPTPIPEVTEQQPCDTGKDFTLVVVSSAGGVVTEPGQGVFIYPTGTVVNLVAVPDPGCEFDKWTGNVTNPNSPETTINVEQYEVVKAYFICKH